MTKQNRYTIFLNNSYSKQDNQFYLKRLKNAITIAVDGGLRFFLKNKIKPDILIGDFDSLPKISKALRDSIEVIEFPVAKNKTDAHLAVELALERNAKEIEFCGALSTSEIDHTLGNILLLKIIKESERKSVRKIKGSIVDSEKQVLYAKDETISLAGRPGVYISLVPLANNCRFKYKGLVYPAPEKAVSIGDSRTLRNQFKTRRAVIEITGEALIIYYSRRI